MKTPLIIDNKVQIEKMFIVKQLLFFLNYILAWYLYN